MATQTTFRLRFPVKSDETGYRAALAVLADLPLVRARAFKDECEEVGNVSPGITIASLVPADFLETHDHWSFDPATNIFIFAGDIISARYRLDYDNDGDPMAADSQPNRQDALLTALESICAAESGCIVGAWNYDHLESWQPVVYLDGCLLRGFTGHLPDYSHRGPFLEHNGRLNIALLDPDPDHGSINIPSQAFAPIA